MDENNSVGERIKKYRKMNKMTQGDLGKHLGVALTTVSSWERGANNPLMDNITKMARLWNVNVSDIIGEVTPTNIIPITTDNVVAIPIIGTIACGDPILADENIIGYRYHLKDTLPSGETFYLKAKGDSMEPKIPNGADVLIRHQDTVEDGEIAAVLVNGDTEVTLKRVRYQGDSVMLVAENSNYPPYIINKENPARILGKAVEFVFDL
jgi:repressor LexA